MQSSHKDSVMLVCNAWKSFYNHPYHRDDGGGDVLELDATLMQRPDQQLPVLPSVLMLHVVRLHHLFLQH